ncbi:MAG: phage tail sheath protein, partial [Pseudonocardiaceae bacterium]
MVGTAAMGPVGVPQLLGSYTDAVQRFGAYDRWVDGASGELTLVRALEQAYRFGATTVWAVRVADGTEKKAAVTLKHASGDCVNIEALSPGTWGNDITVEVSTSDANAVVSAEEVATSLTLGHKPVVQSAVNRIIVRPSAGGADQVPNIVYETTTKPAPDPTPTQVKVNTDTGVLTFVPPPAGAKVLATYTVDKTSAVKVTVKAGLAVEEVYSVVSGDDLIADLKIGSTLVEATAPGGFSSKELPKPVLATPLTGGLNGAGVANGVPTANYHAGLDALLTVDAHIIVAAGQDQSFGNRLATHCTNASGDEIKRDRIAIVGTGLQKAPPTPVADASGHPLN